MQFNFTLSIIIPTYNSEATLDSCLKSLENQLWQDFEVLIIDGLSSDRTLDIVATYALKNSNVKVFCENDNGVYDAMNKGLKIASGRFIYFLGSDDQLYSPTVLHDIFNDDTQADFIYGNVWLNSEHRLYSGESNLAKLLIDQVSICHQAIFYSRKVFDKLGEFDQKYFIHADYDLNIKCFEDDELMKKYIPITVCIYNQGGISNIRSNADGFHNDITLRHINSTSSIFQLYREYQSVTAELQQLKNCKILKMMNWLFRRLKRNTSL